MITDLTPYRKHVYQFDLTEEEKIELVNAVWKLVDSVLDCHLRLNQFTDTKPSVSLTESNRPKSAKTNTQSHSLEKKKSSQRHKMGDGG